jgi:hypothetical protein
MVRSSPRSRLRLSALVVIVLSIVPLTGCLLMGEDLTRVPPAELLLSACNFEIVDAWRCEGYKSTYYVEGVCKVNGLYLLEGSLSWRAEDGKVAESYVVESLPFPPPKYGSGEIHFTARCDSEPYRSGSTANCLEPQFHTTLAGVPAALLDLVGEAKPVAVGQFSAGDLAEFPLLQNCAPELPTPKRPRPRPVPDPDCPQPERTPALIVVSPQANELFDALEVESFELALDSTVREPVATGEIEWQRLESGRFVPVDDLPEQARWAALPLTLALDQGRGGVPGGFYRVRVRPYDASCPRTWSYWQTFRTLHGIPEWTGVDRG